MSQYMQIECRICGSSLLYDFLSLGEMPIPNGFLAENRLTFIEPKYPLGVCVCEACKLVQLTHVVPAEVMFENYMYIPSTSQTMLDHFSELANELTNRLELNRSDLVVDIGSNDGTLLSFFNSFVEIHGVDPAKNLAEVANRKGYPTTCGYFNTELANELLNSFGRAKAITATNVLAHVDDLNDFCEGIKALLHEDGLFVVEFPYAVDLIKNNEFDTIYHEHLSYFSIQSLVWLLDNHDLRISDIKRIDTHGGSLRVFISHRNDTWQPQEYVTQTYIISENDFGLNDLKTYYDFAKRVAQLKIDLKTLLKSLKKQGKSIVTYGASAKGNVLLNYCEIGTSLIDYIVDSISFKQNKYSPGTHIPIRSEEYFKDNPPDYAILTAWNFAKEIMEKQKDFAGKFIIPVPQVKILND